MVHRLPGSELSVFIAARGPQAPPPPVGARWLFAFWMAVAAIVALGAGLVLGILAALEASIGGDRWTPTVQAHGRLQLFGFAATFIVVLALEFLPRLNGRQLFFARVRVAIPAALGTGAVLMAAAQAFETRAGFLAIPGLALSVAGAGGFFAVALRTRGPSALRSDPQPLFIQAAAGWLAVSVALSGWALARSDAGVFPLEHSRAVVEVFLRGFVMLTIVGVGLRAFVGHLGLEPLRPSRQLVVLGAFNTSLALWLLAQGLGPLPRVEWLSRAADVGHAVTILLFTFWLGLLPRLRPKLPPQGARYQLLVPVAWTGAVVYSLSLMSVSLVPGLRDLDLFQEGAVRHIYLVAFVVPLMIAMAHVVLARFGTGRVEWENALSLAFFLALAAWPLRVLPPLFSSPPGPWTRGLIGFAGLLLMSSLALVAAVCLRTAFVMARARARN